MDKITRQDALDYHSHGRKGKIQVVPTKPTETQRDLSLAYTPGVAHPCKEIEADPLLGYEYTARGNLVAVITNGTAVLGLGDIGPLAGKPVMEGKGVLFKRFADIDVFDLELATHDPEEIIRTWSSCSSRPSAASTSRTSRRRSASRSSERLKGDVDPRLPRRPARHRDHLRRRAAQRPGDRRQGIDEVRIVFSGPAPPPSAASACTCCSGKPRRTSSWSTPRASSTAAAPRT
jgi:hypothetical protein